MLAVEGPMKLVKELAGKVQRGLHQCWIPRVTASSIIQPRDRGNSTESGTVRYVQLGDQLLGGNGNVPRMLGFERLNQSDLRGRGL